MAAGVSSNDPVIRKKILTSSRKTYLFAEIVEMALAAMAGIWADTMSHANRFALAMSNMIMAALLAPSTKYFSLEKMGQGPMKIICFIEGIDVIEKIRRYLGLRDIHNHDPPHAVISDEDCFFVPILILFFPVAGRSHISGFC